MSITPNMQLVVPEVLVTTGPQYATQINSALDVVDAHDHSPGKGVRITPSGLNINTDLPFGNNAATGVKAVALQAQTSVLTTGAVYNKGGNLFYRDGSSNEIQLTSGGALNVSSVGAITGLTSPASAAFVSLNSSFVFQSDVSTYAKLEIGDVLIYSRAGSAGTVKAVSLVADVAGDTYTIRLPASAPLDNQIMRMKSASASQFVDLLGTTNQVNVTQNTSNITLSLPQNIHAAATPTFAGLTLTGGISLSGALTGATTGSFSGNMSFTGGPGSTFSATNYDFTTGTINTNALAPKSGDTIAVSQYLSASTGIKTNTIIPLSGIYTTISNIKSSVVEEETTNAGVWLRGRRNGVAPASGYVGEVNTSFTLGSDTPMIAGPAYYDLLPFILSPGEWNVTGLVMFQIDPNNLGLGNQDVKISQVRAGISANTGSFDSQAYAASLTVPFTSDIGGNSPTYGTLVVQTPTRRIRVSASTAFTLGVAVNHNALAPIRGSKFLAATTLKIERVG